MKFNNRCGHMNKKFATQVDSVFLGSAHKPAKSEGWQIQAIEEDVIGDRLHAKNGGPRRKHGMATGVLPNVNKEDGSSGRETFPEPSF